MSSTSSRTDAAQVPAAGLDPESKPVEEVRPAPQPVAPQFPEAGLKAWMVVLGCWCTSFASFGIVNSFG